MFDKLDKSIACARKEIGGIIEIFLPWIVAFAFRFVTYLLTHDNEI